MCHVDKFDDFNKTIATYGYLRGTGQVIRNVKNFYYMDIYIFLKEHSLLLDCKFHQYSLMHL